jgi:FkbH-like protein
MPLTSIDSAASLRLQEILDTVDRAPSAATYAQAARELGASDLPLAPARVAVLSSFTMDLVRPYLQVELARHRLALELYLAPFNTVQQEMLGAESGCITHRPDVVFIARQLVDICPALVHDFLGTSTGQIEAHIDEIVTNTVGLVESFRNGSTAAVVVHLFAQAAEPLLGAAEPAVDGSQTAAIRELNARLTSALKDVPGTYVLDFDRVAATVGYRNAYDDKLWHLARAPLTAAALQELAKVQAGFVQAVLGRQAKCVVLDLDGTLWGGVVGELDVESIRLGGSYPGSAFLDFHRVLLALRERGVLLAINSKNNQADVDAVFERHPHTLLRREHFAAARINWQDKAQNMRELADELHIGLDAIVFVDDNPAERALMRQLMPEVRTLDVPADPLKCAHVLTGSHYFDRLNLSAEDRQRARLYRDQAQRRALANSAPSLDSFLESLEMRAEISRASAATLSRVFDLIQKTNQFNLTTRRHTAAALARMLDDPSVGVFTMRLRDRFGDQGIIGVAIVRLRGGHAVLDTLLLSCRVIGRNVETTLLSHVAAWARSRGARTLEGEFIPTAKNAPAADFFGRHGFAETHRAADAVRWRVDLNTIASGGPSYIAFETAAIV